MNRPSKHLRKTSFLPALALLVVVLAVLVSGCKGSDTAPFGSSVSITTVGNEVILSTPTGTTKTQIYRVSVFDSTGFPMNGMTVNVTGNFTSGVQINFNGVTGSAGELFGFSKSTNASGFIDFPITAPFLNGQQMPAPVNVTTSSLAGGGSLPGPQNFEYFVTALDFYGNETEASAVASAATTTNNSSVTVTWPAVPQAFGYKVYGRNPGTPGFLFVTPDSATLTWTDAGTATPGTATPPSINSTSAANSIQGTLTATTGASVANKDVSM